VIVDNHDFALDSISHAAQVLYPDLVIKAISNYPNDPPEPQWIVDELWSNLDVVKAYFQIDGEYHDRFPATLKENRGFGLLVADYSPENFEEATTIALRSDKAFMIEAVTKTSYLLSKANGPLRRDFDVAIAVFGEVYFARDYVTECLDDDEDGIEKVFWDGFYMTAVDKINAYEGFTQAFAYGLMVNAGNDSPLAMLANDQETSLALKKLVFEFRGVPKASDLPLLRQAVSVLRSVRDRRLLME